MSRSRSAPLLGCPSAPVMARVDIRLGRGPCVGAIGIPKTQSLSPHAVTSASARALVRGMHTDAPSRNSPSRRREASQPQEPSALPNLKPCRESGLINSALWHPDTAVWLRGPKLVFLPSSLLPCVIYLLGQRLLRGPQHRAGRRQGLRTLAAPHPRTLQQPFPSDPRPRVAQCYLEEYVPLAMHFFLSISWKLLIFTLHS